MLAELPANNNTLRGLSRWWFSLIVADDGALVLWCCTYTLLAIEALRGTVG